MDWIQIFVNLVVTGILLYVFQKIVDERSAKRLEKFKTELQSITFEKEAKFSKLHELHSVVIAELYKKLFRLREAVKSVKLFLEDPDLYIDIIVDQKRGDAHENAAEFRIYFQANRLYIPEKICNQIDSIYDRFSLAINTLWTLSLDMKLANMSTKEATEYIKEHYQERLQALFALNEQLDPLLKPLENDFRNLLGS